MDIKQAAECLMKHADKLELSKKFDDRNDANNLVDKAQEDIRAIATWLKEISGSK